MNLRFLAWSVQWMVNPLTEAEGTVSGTDLRVKLTVSTVRNSSLLGHPLLKFVYQKLIYKYIVIIFFFKNNSCQQKSRLCYSLKKQPLSALAQLLLPTTSNVLGAWKHLEQPHFLIQTTTISLICSLSHIRSVDLMGGYSPYYLNSVQKTKITWKDVSDMLFRLTFKITYI